MAGAVVAEQVELDLQGLGGAQVLEERVERSRRRQLVDEAEQEGGTLLGAKRNPLDQLGGPRRDRCARGREPLGAEIERVVVLVEDGGHAHQHLCRLGDVDLDRDGPQPREIQHLRLLSVRQPSNCSKPNLADFP